VRETIGMVITGVGPGIILVAIHVETGMASALCPGEIGAIPVRDREQLIPRQVDEPGNQILRVYPARTNRARRARPDKFGYHALTSRTARRVRLNVLPGLRWMMTCGVRGSFAAAIPGVTILPEVTPDAVSSCQMGPSPGRTGLSGTQVIEVTTIVIPIETRIIRSQHRNLKGERYPEAIGTIVDRRAAQRQMNCR
jgi:hypothetical protein